MAIRIDLERTESNLFCSSKWWGDPDMPAELDYPTVRVEEDGEAYDYPLTFVCQINCEDLEALDPEGRLPHEGMFYVFAALDAYAGYDSPVPTGPGAWPRGTVAVKYAKSVNFETFRSCMLVGEDDEPLTEEALKMVFSPCDDDAACTRLLGGTADGREGVCFLEIAGGTAGLQFPDGCTLRLSYAESDFRFGNWKRVKAFLG